MYGSAAFVIQSAPKRFVSICCARLLVGDLLDRAEEAVAGVVDDDVELPEVVVRLGDGGVVGVVSVTSRAIGRTASP